MLTVQIDLESSEDDIQEIQQEIAVLATCASPFVTQYKASFLRGHKLWIVMEYLGGGSCLDLVRQSPSMVEDANDVAKTRHLQRSPRRNHLPTTPPRPRLPAQ